MIVIMLSARFCIIRSGVRSKNGFSKLQHNKQFNKKLFTGNNSLSTVNISLCEPSNNKQWFKESLRCFSSEQFSAPKNPDVFGDIGGHKYERIELDESEKELEEFEKTESTVPRSLKLSPGQYATLIKEHIARRDLESALNVLELVKSNRDKPTAYMYNLLIREFAVQGNLKKCLKLYTVMKKRQLTANGATYTSMLNACANYPHREIALEKLNDLRQELIEKNVLLNETHYNAMVKAYGRHQCILEAFQIVDDMVDKKIPIGEVTMNSLLYASISDKQNGLRHSLIVWHLMQWRRIKPSILTYNLLLRAIRDTKLGDLKINDRLIERQQSSQILLTDNDHPDLLANPPVVSNFALDNLTRPMEKNVQEYKQSAAPSKINTEEKQIKELSSAERINLSEIHEKNRLILFGGFTGFISRMEKDNITPDAKTITLLMDVVPDSLSIEKSLIATARTKKIPLDIDFFNMLIKRRSFRKDYKHAKEVVDEIQISGLTPNVITWGVLALGCKTRDEARALLEGMDATGHTLNSVIAGALIGNACSTNHFRYVLEIMELMYKNRVRPSEELYTILDKFQKKISDIVLNKVKSKHSKNPRYKELFSKFNMRYASWQEQFGREKRNQTTNSRQR